MWRKLDVAHPVFLMHTHSLFSGYASESHDIVQRYKMHIAADAEAAEV